jgi:hypothetical protein
VDTGFKKFEMGQTEISYKNEFSHTNLKNAKLSKIIFNESGNELFLFRHPNYQKLWRIRSKKNIPENRIGMVSLCPDLIFWGQM